MKKLFALILALSLLLALCACGEKTPIPLVEQPSETAAETAPEAPADAPVRLGGLKGPTTMGMVKLLSDNDKGLTENKYTFQMAAAADELTPALLKNDLDIIAVPINLSAVLHKNSEHAVQLLAVNTLGVLYILEKGGETVTDVQSLRGKTIYATGKGSVPYYTLRYLMQQNGMDIDNDVTMEWKSEPTEIVAQLSSQEQAVAMLPQPFVTVASSQVEGLRVALNLTEEWDKLGNAGKLVTAGLVVRKAFADEHPDKIAKFLEEYAASVNYVNANPADAAKLIESYDIAKAPIAEKAIPQCNLVCITGKDMQPTVEGYLQSLYEQRPNAVGGVMPDADYYYGG